MPREVEVAVKIRFGTEGWRGIIAREFTFDTVALVTQGIVDYLKREGLAGRGVVIGYDRRFLSRAFAERVAEIAAGNGVSALLADSVVPTPAVSWGVHEEGAGGGIMITASHNPPQYNGLKFKEQFGGPARPATTRLIETMVADNVAAGRQIRSVPLAEAIATGTVRSRDLRDSYCRQLARLVDLELIRSSGIAAAVDPMFGAGSGVLSTLVPGLTEINTDDNPGFHGRSPEPSEENLGELSALVKSGRCRVGLALDGDADRIGAVDETGSYLSPHAIFTLLLRHLVTCRGLRGGVVKTVSTTRMIDLLCEKYGLPLYETPIGFKHICELMLERDILMGGEEAGGLGVKGHIPERDGILMALLLLEVMAVNGRGLRQLLDETMNEIGRFWYRRIDLPLTPEAGERLMASLREKPPPVIASRPVREVNFRDGFKAIFSDGSWLLVRPSGTEPVLRIYSEAGDPATVQSLLTAGRTIAGV